MKSKDQLYKAQTIGNIEPIEYMIPYPSTQAIIEGQVIKYGDEIVFEDYNLTNIQFYELIQKTSHWLHNQGISPKDNVVIKESSFLDSILLLYGLWHLGAVAVFLYNPDQKIDESIKAKFLNYDNTLIDQIESLSSKFIPKYKALLNENAVISISEHNSLSFSHYGLLVNANGLQKGLNLYSNTKFFCDLEPNSSFWVVLCAILPVYSMCTFSSKNPSIILTTDNIQPQKGFRLRKDWKNIEKYKVNELGLCEENSAVISIGQEPLHLTDFKINNDELWLKGHSLMNGYLNKELMTFKEDYLIINNKY